MEFPSTYKQVVKDKERLDQLETDYMSKLINTIFNAESWENGRSDLGYDSTEEKMKVIGGTVLSDNEDVDLLPNQYRHHITWETKKSSVIGLSGMLNIGEYVILLTVTVPDRSTWQVAYSDMHLATYFRKSRANRRTWTEWESVGTKQVITSSVQPSDNSQDIGDYWFQKLGTEFDIIRPERMWRKVASNRYERLYPETSTDAIHVGATEETLTDRITTMEQAIEEKSGDIDDVEEEINTLDEKVDSTKAMLETDIANNRAEVDASIRRTEESLTDEINDVRSDLTETIDDTKTDLQNTISANYSTLNNKIDTTRTTLENTIATNRSAAEAALNSHASNTVSHITTEERSKWNAKQDALAFPLAADKGGTGQTSLQATRNAMGLGNTTGALPVANGGTGNNSVDTAPTANSTKMVTSGGVYTAIETLKTSVSNGKSAIASAITDMGVSTSSSASFDVMAANIRAIQTGSPTGYNGIYRRLGGWINKPKDSSPITRGYRLDDAEISYPVIYMEQLPTTMLIATATYTATGDSSYTTDLGAGQVTITLNSSKTSQTFRCYSGHGADCYLDITINMSTGRISWYCDSGWSIGSYGVTAHLMIVFD